MRSLPLALASLALLTLAACGDDGGSAGPDARTDAPDGAPTCQAYCTAITANCTAAADKQYNNMAECLASCAFIPAGTSGDTMGNTVGCRTYHGGTPAQSNPTLHCPHAGPGGDGACGMNCAGFCQTVMGACTGANAAYADDAACMTACAAFPTGTRYNTTAQTGDTLACRLYHATVATIDPTLHCPHVRPTGGPCS